MTMYKYSTIGAFTAPAEAFRLRSGFEYEQLEQPEYMPAGMSFSRERMWDEDEPSIWYSGTALVKIPA